MAHDFLNVSYFTLSAALTDLNNFTNYTVSVSANTVVGRGPTVVTDERTDENGKV